jgi:hypothetical protein
MDQAELVRAVLDAARTVRHATEEPDLHDLIVAVDALEATLTARSSGFIVKRGWAEQEPGNWVSPDGSSEWFLVTDVVPFEVTPGKTDVEIEVRGKRIRASRDSAQMVRTRTHTKREPVGDAAMEAAVKLIMESFPGSEVLSDG